MDPSTISADFDAKRKWLSNSWLAVFLSFAVVSPQLWVLDWLRYRLPGVGGTAVGVALWVGWWRWQNAAEERWIFRLGATTVRMFIRGAVLFLGAVAWQWWTQDWLMSWTNLLSSRGHICGIKVFVIAFWAPLTEELVFRVLLLSKIRRARSKLSSSYTMALVNGILFSLHHIWNLMSFPRGYVFLQCAMSFISGVGAALHMLVHGPEALFEVTILHIANNVFAMFYDPSVVVTGSNLLVFMYLIGLVLSNSLWIAENHHQEG